ncbi:cell envelope biogenesis protein OmpA [Photobacterium proteolyticum]|uniref:Cell envelope biogenesis protein OmpA n=1 Tax=Photobacterium proteolyticum TaxID=1903952 RepID=A0A1Q9GAH0_9GAMM|nr:sortase-associated OmpA-like protein PdsO [Photobacterium proteolyticum]OLQ71331.1 cell envelope biogenesis protein OmpA [Photobacterium proteolyticum]
MKKQLISTLIATTMMASVITPATQAAEGKTSGANTTPDAYTVGQDEQLIGMGSGAAFGALVGGPAGAVIGAIVGGIAGTAMGQEQHIQAQDEEMLELTARNGELERISQRYNQSQIEIARLQQQLIDQNSLEQRQIDLALEMNVHFRTGSARIEPHFEAQLEELAELMKQAPDVKWELAGYADRRGDSLKNYNLSQRRVDAVRDYLEQRGVDGNQIFASAYGDQEPLKAEQNFEGDFFDRRVTLRSSQSQVRTANTH